jgi:putative ABC transport system permease protein
MRKSILLIFLLFSCTAFATEPEILINPRLAQRMHLNPGDSVQISASGDMKNAVALRVKAIYEEKADPYNVPLKRNMVKMHLADIEKITGRRDQVDLISLRLRKGVDPRELAARLNSEAIGFTAYSAEELARKSSTTFQVVSRFHQAIAIITMMAGAIFIFALVVMRVEDQRKNLAIMSVTGISRTTILKSLILESMFFAFFASLLGAAIGYASAAAVNVYYQHYYQTTLIFARVTAAILLRAILLSFLFGLVAGTFSWFRLRRLALLEELGR